MIFFIFRVTLSLGKVFAGSERASTMVLMLSRSELNREVSLLEVAMLLYVGTWRRVPVLLLFSSSSSNSKRPRFNRSLVFVFDVAALSCGFAWVSLDFVGVNVMLVCLLLVLLAPPEFIVYKLYGSGVGGVR